MEGRKFQCNSHSSSHCAVGGLEKNRTVESYVSSQSVSCSAQEIPIGTHSVCIAQVLRARTSARSCVYVACVPLMVTHAGQKRLPWILWIPTCRAPSCQARMRCNSSLA